jgi:transcriptional regulator with XRE-family HTH domain
MNLFLIVRNGLGINQESLANLLGVSLALLKKAETNQRNLPAEAISRLVLILDWLQKLPENRSEKTYPSVLVGDLLQKTIKKKRELEARIENRQTKNQQMQKRLLFQTAFEVKFPEEKFPAEASQILALSYEAESFFQQEDPEYELFLLAQLSGLAAMIAFLEKQAPKTF